MWQAAYSAPSDAFLPRYSDGPWGYYPADTQGAPNSIVNLAISGVGKSTTTRINTDFTLEQDLSFVLKGLKASATISWDNAFVENDRGINDLYHDTQFKWINPDTGEAVYQKNIQGNTNFDFQEGIQWTTQGGTASLNYRNLFYQAQLYWANRFGKHDVSAMGVVNRKESTWGSDFTSIVKTGPSVPPTNYDGRYFVEYNGCYNGSENFAPKYRFASSTRCRGMAGERGEMVQARAPVYGHAETQVQRGRGGRRCQRTLGLRQPVGLWQHRGRYRRKHQERSLRGCQSIHLV